jgi:hypothetical protein
MSNLTSKPSTMDSREFNVLNNLALWTSVPRGMLGAYLAHYWFLFILLRHIGWKIKEDDNMYNGVT